MKIATIEQVQVSLPLTALVLLGIAHAEYDTTVECRGFAREYIGQGIAAAGSHYSVTQDEVMVEGKQVPCVRLTVRPSFYTGEPLPPVDHLFPFEELKSLEVLVGMAIPVDLAAAA